MKGEKRHKDEDKNELKKKGIAKKRRKTKIMQK